MSKKDRYDCIKKHLYQAFMGKSDEELFERGEKLNGLHPKARLMKLRVLSCGGNAKSEGFRLIVFVRSAAKEFIFLDAYPKTGPLAKSNMKKEERKQCLEEYKSESLSSKLYTAKLNSTTLSLDIVKPKPLIKAKGK